MTTLVRRLLVVVAVAAFVVAGVVVSRRSTTHVAAAYGTNRERAEQFQSELKRSGKTVSIHRGDVGSAEDCQRIVGEVIDHHGRIDVLVNNAGITSLGRRDILEATEESWDAVLAIGLLLASALRVAMRTVPTGRRDLSGTPGTPQPCCMSCASRTCC